MLKSFRTKLSTYRQSSAPVASLVDFGLWVLRNAMPPWRPKFWIVAAVIGAGLFAAAMLPAWRAVFVAATVGFAVLVLLMLVLSYVRTMIREQNVTLARNAQHQAAQLTRFAGEQRASRRNDQVAFRKMMETGGMGMGPNALVKTISAQALCDLLDGDFMTALADAQDGLRSDLDALIERVDGAPDGLSVAELRADLDALARRTDRQLRLDSGAIAHLAARLDKGAGSAVTGAPPRRASGAS